MHRHTSSAVPPAGDLKTGLRLAAAVTAAVSLAACQQFQTPSDLLFAPTFTKNRQDIPKTYNTPYDCRTFSGTGWKGIAGGVVVNFGQKYQLSQAGCFQTERECQAYLAVMRSYIDVPRFIRCNPYSA